ncbi:mobile element protein [Vibrio astriarenae]|nr:mobile element protein [Vibrio sp. C7]
MLNKGQFDFWLRRDERKTLVRERAAFMNRLFNVEVIFS